MLRGVPVRCSWVRTPLRRFPSPMMSATDFMLSRRMSAPIALRKERSSPGMRGAALSTLANWVKPPRSGQRMARGLGECLPLEQVKGPHNEFGTREDGEAERVEEQVV